MLSIAEENYIKKILSLNLEYGAQSGVGTNELASGLAVKPSTVNDMLKKLRAKELIDYEKYGKIFLTKSGRKIGMEILRKHRLWETFLYEKLEFTWDEVHEVAEQLEHIQSKKLVQKLDKFLAYPRFDPHGDPIPSEEGVISDVEKTLLADSAVGKKYKLIAVKDNSAAFLNYVVELGLGLNNTITLLSKLDFDESMEIEVNHKKTRVSKKFTENIFVVPI